MNINPQALSPVARAMVQNSQGASRIMSDGRVISRGIEFPRANRVVDWAVVESSIRNVFAAMIRKPKEEAVQILGVSVGKNGNPHMGVWLSGRPFQVDRLDIYSDMSRGTIARRYTSATNSSVRELAFLRQHEVERASEALSNFDVLKGTILAHFKEHGEMPQQLFDYLLGASSKI